MKQKNKLSFFLLSLLLLAALACNNTNGSVTEKRLAGYPEEAINSVLITTDSSSQYPFVKERIGEIRKSLLLPNPVLLCKDSLSNDQQLAQIIALSEPSFIKYVKDAKGNPFRNEIFGVFPARQSDFADPTAVTDLKNVYRVEMYNYGLNLSSVALVNSKTGKVIAVNHMPQTQPEISADLKELAIRIAVNSPEVQKALSFQPGKEDALMSNTKTALNRSRCERSNHLCVAPTFTKDGKALWAIVDLTDFRLVGIRWTNTGTTGPAAPLTEKKLQDDKVTSCYCEVEQPLNKNGWNMKYMLTSSDGLRISDVTFNNKPVIRSAKLVDWHVSYSGTDGFGYSDAVGCPYFSQAAVVAWTIPEVASLMDDNNNTIGFVLEQSFRSEGWPSPCNYNYRQRFEFYNDGRFRVAGASVGRGCGNDGTYRPVFRIALAGDNNFYSWNNNTWEGWSKEKWNEQTAQSTYSGDGYLYKAENSDGGYYIEPGKGQFKDGGKGDFSFMYVTKHSNVKDEGESDLLTIGPCCNTDYHQGPEKFIEPEPENIQNTSLVLWYVAQLKNNDQKGNEYCWAESVLQDGVYITKVYPCFAGPMFIPIKK